MDGSPASPSAPRWAAGEAKQRHAGIVAVPRMSPCPVVVVVMVVVVPPGPVAAQDADAPAAETTAAGQCAW